MILNSKSRVGNPALSAPLILGVAATQGLMTPLPTLLSHVLQSCRDTRMGILPPVMALLHYMLLIMTLPTLYMLLPPSTNIVYSGELCFLPNLEVLLMSVIQEYE